MGWWSNLRARYMQETFKGEAERAAAQMYGNGQAAEDHAVGGWIIDDLNKEPSGTTLSDEMQRRGKVDWSMRDAMRPSAEQAERLDRMDAAAQLDREVANEIAGENAAPATEPTQEAIDHELAVMNEERDQRWAAQDRKAMDIPEPSAGAPWRNAQAHEPETEAPARSVDPA
jgi:hypothetical protein